MFFATKLNKIRHACVPYFVSLNVVAAAVAAAEYEKYHRRYHQVSSPGLRYGYYGYGYAQGMTVP